MATVLSFPISDLLEYIDLTDTCMDCGEEILATYFELPVRVGNVVITKGICFICYRSFLKQS